MDQNELTSDANELLDNLFMAEMRLNLFKSKYSKYFPKADLNESFEQAIIAHSLLDSAVAALIKIWDKNNKDYPNRITFYTILENLVTYNLDFDEEYLGSIRENSRFKKVQNLRHTLIAHLARKCQKEEPASYEDIEYLLDQSIKIGHKISKALNLSYKRYVVEIPDPATSAG